MEEGGWGNGVASKVPGMLVRANNSATLQTITLADNGDMAILVKPSIPQSLKFRRNIQPPTIIEPRHHVPTPHQQTQRLDLDQPAFLLRPILRLARVDCCALACCEILCEFLI